MTILVPWLRVDLRRRWRSLTVLTLLITLAGATVMAALADARRGASALQRLSAPTLPATTAVLPNTPGFDWTKIEKLPEVAALTKFIVDDLYAYQGIPNSGSFPPVDAAYGTTVEKPVIFSGRIYNPSRDDEAVVTPKFVKTYHKGVGDNVVLELPSAKQLADPASSEGLTTYDGPRIKTRIVGVILSKAIPAAGPEASLCRRAWSPAIRPKPLAIKAIRPIRITSMRWYASAAARPRSRSFGRTWRASRGGRTSMSGTCPRWTAIFSVKSHSRRAAWLRSRQRRSSPHFSS
jgi:hypothetical protein